MKKLVMLLLLLVFPAYAVSLNSEYVNGDISPDQFKLVTCEREKRLGSVGRIDNNVCCRNDNENLYCENDEPLLGECFANACIWGTPTFRPWFSWRYRRAPCDGLAILAGREYTSLLEWAGCEKTDIYWCCSPYAFPPLTAGIAVPERKVEEKSSSPTGALVVLDKSKWRAMELGGLKFLKYEQRVFQFEQSRCGLGGKDLKIWDMKYGSFFGDTRNLKPGMRVFYLEGDRVTPLVTWCEKK